MKVALEPHARGTILPVRAQPGARLNGIRGFPGGGAQGLGHADRRKGEGQRGGGQVTGQGTRPAQEPGAFALRRNVGSEALSDRGTEPGRTHSADRSRAQNARRRQELNFAASRGFEFRVSQAPRALLVTRMSGTGCLTYTSASPTQSTKLISRTSNFILPAGTSISTRSPTFLPTRP